MKEILRAVIVFLLTLEARLVLAKYRPQIIAVTGSVGKTSAKDAIYSALLGSYFVRKSDKSYNSDIGIPLAILGLKTGWGSAFTWGKNIIEGLTLILFPNRYPRWLVLEVGADRPDDIRRIAKWLSPDVVVVTHLPDVPVHVEFFGSAEELFLEKKSLIDALKKGGALILNADDERVLAFRAGRETAVITYGMSRGAAVRASNVSISYKNGVPVGMHVRVNYEGSSVPLHVNGSLGVQHVYPLLAAAAVGVSLKLNLVKMAESLSGHVSPPGRMRLIAGINNSVIIDDSYNASPVAALEALKTLGEVKATGRKIAVLGDMLELGRFSVEEHRRVGVEAAKVASLLVTVGIRSRYTAGAAREAGMKSEHVLSFDDAASAGKALVGMISVGDVILVKGSQSIRTERVVEALMKHPEEKEKLLARQDTGWQRR